MCFKYYFILSWKVNLTGLKRSVKDIKTESVKTEINNAYIVIKGNYDINLLYQRPVPNHHSILFL